MKRLLPLLVLLLPACSSRPAPAPPSWILSDASVTGSGKGDEPSAPETVREPELVPWIVTELSFEPLPFDSKAIVGEPNFVRRWEAQEHSLGTVNIGSHLQGLPADALFLEPVPGESEVLWADGSAGTIREISWQGPGEGKWHFSVLTSVPPESSDIKSVTIALDLHQSTRVRRHEVRLGMREEAAIEFGHWYSRWLLSEDGVIFEDTSPRDERPDSPLFDRGLNSDRLLRLTDASDTALQEWCSVTGGSRTSQTWVLSQARKLTPPLRVTVDLPLETTTTRVVLRMKDLRLKK